MTCFTSGKEDSFEDSIYIGSTYKTVSSIGITSKLPRITSDPPCDHKFNCCDITLSWLIRFSICCGPRSEEHTSELQSRGHLVCRLLLEKKKNKHIIIPD